MAKYKPGDIIKFSQTANFSEEHALVLAVKGKWYNVYIFEEGLFDKYDSEWVDSRIYVNLAK